MAKDDAPAFAGLVLAAGRGSRFREEGGEPFPKVVRPVLGRPMVLYVLDALAGARVTDVTLVVGFLADEVKRAVGGRASYVIQPEQKGSGHAVACAAERYRGFGGGLVVMCGDSPLFTPDTIGRILREHLETGAAVTLASALLDEPFGYGRILRDADGRITGVVEQKCATAEQRTIREVNGGAYAFDSRWLFGNIDRMEINSAGEYNLTDMVRIAIEQGRTVSAIQCDPVELLGVNTPEQLRTVEYILGKR